MSTSLIWWLTALVLGGIELLTGTFYLLVLATGAAAAGVAAWLGLSLTLQFLAGALVCLGGWFVLRRRRTRGGEEPALDVGGVVRIAGWEDARETTVRYRGAPWRAELAPGVPDPAPAGDYRIDRVAGTRLVVSPMQRPVAEDD